MKNLLLIFTLFLMCSACKKTIINPELSKLNGKWQLYQISAGFRAPNTPPFYTPNYTEYLDINTKSMLLIRTKNEIKTEETQIELKQYSINDNPRVIMHFLATDTYSFYTLGDETDTFILYQKTPMGSELADGSSYYYRKVK